MARLWAIIKREYTERVRTKWFIFATIFGPLFFGTAIILPAVLTARGGTSGEFGNFRVLDATGSGIGQRVADRIAGAQPPGSPVPEVLLVERRALSQAESTATHQVMQRQISGYLVVDDLTLEGQHARYSGRNATSIGDMERIRTVVRDVLLQQRLAQAGIDSARARDLTFVPLRIATERISDRGRGGSGRVNIVFAAVVAFLLYISIVIYGQNILRGVLEEKTTRVAEVVVSSVRPETLLAGKILGVGAVGLTQQILWVTTTALILKVREPLLGMFGVTVPAFALPDISFGLALLLFLFFILGFGFYAALHAALGASVNSEQEAQQAVQPIIVVLVASAVFVNPVLMNPGSTLAIVASVLPFSAPIIMPLRLALGSVPWQELAASLTGLALSCLLATWLAAKIYRVGLLMYGKRPTLREMGRWIRQAR